MKRFPLLLGGLAVLLLSSCLPEERFWWSPDGLHVVVRIGDALHLVEADGEPGAPLVEDLGTGDDLPRRVSWQQDGKGLVINQVRRHAAWAEVRGQIPVEEVTEVERLSKGVPALISAWLASIPSEGDASSITGWGVIRGRETLTFAILVAYETQKDAVEAELSKSPRAAEMLNDLRNLTLRYPVHEICHVKLKGTQRDGEVQPIARSLYPLFFAKVSPKYGYVSFIRVVDDGETVALEVRSLDGKSRLEVARGLSATCEWTADGRSLVYAAPVSGKDEGVLQYIRRATVLQENGSLVQPDSKAEPAQEIEMTDLAIALVPSAARVIALPDGRVLFAGQPATLPAPGAGLEVAPRLFIVSEDGKTISQVPTAPGDLPANLGYFAVSPDGRRLAVVESDTDAVAVVDLQDGKTEIVSPAHPQWQCRTMPSWKSSTELTFAALKDGAPRWMLWNQGEGVRCISDKWPASATAEWLQEKKKQGAEQGGTP